MVGSILPSFWAIRNEKLLTNNRVRAKPKIKDGCHPPSWILNYSGKILMRDQLRPGKKVSCFSSNFSQNLERREGRFFFYFFSFWQPKKRKLSQIILISCDFLRFSRNFLWIPDPIFFIFGWYFGSGFDEKQGYFFSWP